MAEQFDSRTIRVRVSRALAGLVVAAILLFGAFTVSGQQDKPAASASAPVASAAPKPAPEMEKINFYMGIWDYTESYPKSKMFPDGAENTGVYTTTAGPGGNSLINHFHSKGPAGEFEGLIVRTWDPAEKQYKGYFFADQFPGCTVENGQFEDGLLVFRAEFSMGATKVKSRTTAQLLSPGKMEVISYMAMNGGPEQLAVKVEATKR